MATTGIMTAFMAKLDIFGALPIAWPGRHTSPPSTGMWLEVKFFPNEPQNLSWDNDSQQLLKGYFQIGVFYRPGINIGQVSSVTASELADSLINHFPKGLRLLRNIRIFKTAWQRSAFDMEGKSVIPITIPYLGISEISEPSVPDNAIVDDQGRYVFDDQGRYVTL